LSFKQEALSSPAVLNDTAFHGILKYQVENLMLRQKQTSAESQLVLAFKLVQWSENSLVLHVKRLGH